MLSEDQFDNWCQRQKLSQPARKTLELIRKGEPSRRVGGGRKNVSGSYPSQKMGKTIQFESHKVELPFIYQLEHDCDVLEFYDQPPPIKISYCSPNGRQLSFFYTPDFFVIRTEAAVWVECKTEPDLKKLAATSQNRYFLGEDGQWHMPPGEQYAQEFGFFFCIWSDAEIDWVLQRNIIFLEDYYRAEYSCVSSSTGKVVRSLVSAQPGLTLHQLLHQAHGASADDIYFLIATEQIYVDLSATPLVEPKQCFVFRDQQQALAYRSMVLSQATTDAISPTHIDLVSGTSVYWDGKVLTIVLVGDTELVLRADNDQLVKLNKTEFLNWVRLGEITVVRTQNSGSLSAVATEFFIKASSKDLEDANHRYRLLEPYLIRQSSVDSTVPQRTLRDWKAKYQQAQQKYGYGYMGLVSRDSIKGNRNRKLPALSIELMDKFIVCDYETHKQKRKSEVYGAFANACSAAGIPDEQIPSYKTFIKEIKRRSGYEQTQKRLGPRAAYQQEPVYLELELTTPRHGDRPFEIGHIDHTELDIELRCSHTGSNLGRPWATFLVDATSRRILAVYVTFDPPSYRSCMMVLRICLQRHGRLPQSLVVDNGAEFHSTYFESLLALFECTLKHRPPSKARFSAVGERLFGTASTQLLYNLAGNTQITRQVRLTTKSVNPKNLALWTLSDLYVYLCQWAYEVYDTIVHPALGLCPREAFTAGITQFGSRSHRIIAYDENFRLLTLPTTQSGKAKVQPGLGVKINHIYYWSNTFRDPEIEQQRVEVRYDPFDAGIAYAYIRGQWVECISQYYPIFKGRSEKEIKLASAELRKRHQNHAQQFQLRAKQLAVFLNSAESEEVMLSQRLRDAQGKEVFGVIEGGKPSQRLENMASDDGKDDDHSSGQAGCNAPIALNKLQLFERY